ncbi:MAG: hypothetical protein IPO23_13340 [Flavobacterium sp.]|nr:hypothetical protein [Flavobacterium sp.]
METSLKVKTYRTHYRLHLWSRSTQSKNANILFADKPTDKLWNGLEIEQYIRYLQVQYHLTQRVQTTLAMASHPDTRAYKDLRGFLINFGYEEEMHYKLAEKDQGMGESDRRNSFCSRTLVVLPEGNIAEPNRLKDLERQPY